MSAYDHSSQVAELASNIKPIRFAMFTTVDQHGHLISRPMTTLDIDAEGNLWFYTSSQTDLWQDIADHPQVNLSYAEPAENVYVSVSGQAERVVERSLIRDM